MSSVNEIHIEYCSSCGFFAKANDLKENIEKAFGDSVDVEMEGGRPTSFEISVNGKQIYSKLDTKQFPNQDEIMKKIEAEIKVEAKMDQVVDSKTNQAEAKLNDEEEAKKFVDSCIADNEVMVFSKTYCPFCKKAKEGLASNGIKFKAEELDLMADKDVDLITRVLERMTKQTTVPNVFVLGDHIGGGDDTVAKLKSGDIQRKLGKKSAKKRGNKSQSGIKVSPSEIEMVDHRAEMSVEESGAFPAQPWYPLFLKWPLFYFPYVLDANVARATALWNVLVCIITAAAAAETWAKYLASGIFADFVLRFLFGAKGSLLGNLGVPIAYYLPHRVTPGPPKQFAQFVGCCFSGAAALTLWMDPGDGTNQVIAAIILCTLAFFAFLEGAVNFCAGCWFFKHMVNFHIVPSDPSIKCDSMASEINFTMSWMKQRLQEGPVEVVVPEKYLPEPDHKPRSVPLRYRRKTDDQRKEDFDIIKHCPITYFGAGMGITGLPALFKVARDSPLIPISDGLFDATAIVCTILFLCLVLLTLLRLLKYPQKIVKEWDCPMKINFFSAFCINLALLAYTAANETSSLDRLANGLFWIAAPLQMFVTVSIVVRWIRRPHYRAHILPVWMIAPVGNLVIAFVAPVISNNYRDFAYLFFSFGAVMWIVLFTMSFQRITFGNFLPPPVRASIMIYIAAPAILSVTHMTLTNATTFDSFALTTYYFSIGMTFVCLGLIITPYFGREKWHMGYWAYVFPIEALAIASIIYHQTVADTPWTNFIANATLSAAIGLFLIQLASTLRGIAIRHGIFVPEMRGGPFAFTKVTHFAMRFALQKLVNLSRKLGRPEKLEEFAQEYFRFRLVYTEHAAAEEAVMFPYLEQYFPGCTKAGQHQHEEGDMTIKQLDSIMFRLAPHVQQHLEQLIKDPTSIRHGPPSRSTDLKIDSKTADTVHKLITDFDKHTNEHLDFEEQNLGPIIRKYMGFKLQKDLIRKMVLYTDWNKWRIIFPWTVENQEIHMRRKAYLWALTAILPERIQLVGLMLYEGLSEVMWDRLVPDHPEMIPKHIPGHWHYF